MKKRMVAAALAIACGTNVTPASGLMVVIVSDGQLGDDFDQIQLHVNGRAVDTSSVSLPTSLGITGAPGTKVLVEARAVKNGVLRIASVVETTIPNGRTARLDVKLARDCYDRCVQLGPTDTLGDVCDPDSLGTAPTTRVCQVPQPRSVDLLPDYDAAQDPALVVTAAPPSGCTAPSAHCTSTVTCADVIGGPASGTVTCSSSCSRVNAATSCDNGLEPSAWPAVGGQMSRTQLSSFAGPTGAMPTFAPIELGVMNAPAPVSAVPVLASDGTHGYVASRVFDLTAMTATVLPMPSMATLDQELAGVNAVNPTYLAGQNITHLCCDGGSGALDGAAPVITTGGKLYGVSRWGVLYAYLQGPSQPPSVYWLLKDLVKANATLKVPPPLPCTAGCTSGSIAVGKDGTAYVGTSIGLYAIDTTQTPMVRKWGPLGTCPSDSSAPAIGADGRIYVGRSTLDGVCAVTPDGRVQTFEADDGVVGNVHGSPAVGIDGTVYFGTTNYSLHARGVKASWDLSLEGPILAGPAIGGDGTVYVTTSAPSRALYAIDPLGRVKWSVLLRGDTNGYSSPTVAQDGAVYLADAGGFVHAYGPNGTLIWELGLGNGFFGSPVITGGGKLLALRGTQLLVFGSP